MQANVLIERREGLAALGGLAIGSGVVLKLVESASAALILTNRHVVDPHFPEKSTAAEDLGKVEVHMLGQPMTPGRVVWLAPGGIDLALVRADCPKNPEVQAAPWQKGRPTPVGEPVFAIGNPQRLGWTLTRGEFRSSGPRRSVREFGVIQTQTAINAGNSGGGLYDQQGFLIGINTWSTDKSVSEGSASPSRLTRCSTWPLLGPQPHRGRRELRSCPSFCLFVCLSVEASPATAESSQ